MTHDEAKRWLARLGASFKEGKRHTRVYLNGRLSTLPRHGRKEIPPGTLAAIKRQLNIKED
ncbi:MAG: type II toxin-antitoxin system HicA family toxin [Rhodospirillales bacterium]|nr:type II toxin-antitoxin system HicA family toxin [Rhodospirillales bacterium]